MAAISESNHIIINRSDGQNHKQIKHLKTSASVVSAKASFDVHYPNALVQKPGRLGTSRSRDTFSCDFSWTMTVTCSLLQIPRFEPVSQKSYWREVRDSCESSGKCWTGLQQMTRKKCSPRPFSLLGAASRLWWMMSARTSQRDCCWRKTWKTELISVCV